MAQYVIQIQDAENGMYIGWLAKSFEVSTEHPIPSTVPANRVQVVMTNTDSFNSIYETYNEHTDTVFFSYDQPGGTIDCTGVVTDSWPID